MAKTLKSAASVDYTVEQILEECSKAVIEGLGRKRAGRDAASFWITSGKKKIKWQIENGTNWESARKRVLPTAVKMGKVAAALTGDFDVVPLWAAIAASEAVKQDPKCPTHRRGGARANQKVLGGFCP